MNAALDIVPPPEPVPASTPSWVVLEQSALRDAIQEAASSGGSARDILARRTGLSGTAYARALAAAFDYRFIDGDELAQIEPDFAKLAPAEATRRLCVVARERGRLVAIFADPFDVHLRGWLELRIAEELTWALAPGQSG